MPVRKRLVRERVEGLLADQNIQRGRVPVEDVARALGIEIVLDEVDNELSGFLLRDRMTGRTVIGANKRHPQSRIRFTIAHELGHFLLHQGEVVHLDEESVSFTMDFRDGRSARGEDDNEREANLFAAELLMPARFLREELNGKRFDIFDDDGELRELAEKYEVSVQALTFRLTNLGYIRS